VIRRNPSDAEAHHFLGQALEAQGDMTAAANSFREALRANARNGQFHRSLAYVLFESGLAEPSRAEYQEATRLEPGWPREALQKAWTLATHPDPRRRNPQLAVRNAKQVRQALGEDDPRVLDTLAVAYASAGQFAEAIATARLAQQRAMVIGQDGLAREIESRSRMYEKGEAIRDRVP
jgi:Flp pilus assembly protein TadD